jgi:dipeptidyl aminopeptidase/acylaminoacyl peptidase
MILKRLITVLCLLSVLSTFAQKKQLIVDISGTSPVNLTYPFKIDSTNIKGEKFEDKELLKTRLTIPEQDDFTHLYTIGTDGFFHFEKPTANASLQLFSFYLNSDRYGKGTLKITSPNMFEIYSDGTLLTSKTEKDDSLKTDKNIKTTILPYPKTNNIVIKLLSFANDKLNPIMKIEIENEKNDTITNFYISENKFRRIDFADMMLGKRVTNITVSPHGNYVLISYRNVINEKNSQTVTELYDVKKKTHIVIDNNGSKKQLNWMPVSEKLYYITKAGDKTDLMLIDPVSMEEYTFAKNIPDVPIIFAPDEKALFYSKHDKTEESKSDLHLLKSLLDRQPGYLNRSSIYRHDLQTGLSRQLTFGKSSVIINDISADSKQLLISFSEETITERPFRNNTMLIMDLTNMKIDTLWHNESFVTKALFSPDGKKVLITGSAEAFNGIGSTLANDIIPNSYNIITFIMDLKTKTIDPISQNFDPSIENCFWNKKDNLIYLITTDKDYQNVYTYNPKTGKFTKLPLAEDINRMFSVSANSLYAVYYGVSASNSTKAYYYDLKTQKSTLIADPYNEQLSQLNLGQINNRNFVNSEGVEIEGRYYLPPNFDKNKKYPLIVYYYGGTTPTMRTFESSYPAHVFAAQDYVVYVLQPSGTIGYGQQFAAKHVNAWGKRTAEDIIEGTSKFVEEHQFIDNKKIGCIGASYGGFMTMYLLTMTDIFTAAVSHAGISSISSYWGEGYWGYSYSSAASANSYPWNNYDLYVNQSPLFNADKINTPLLLTHGTVDTNVPIGESIQMFTALKILGKEVEFIQVKGENHGISDFKHRIEWNNAIMAWFAKWLKEDEQWWKSINQLMNEK